MIKELNLTKKRVVESEKCNITLNTEHWFCFYINDKNNYKIHVSMRIDCFDNESIIGAVRHINHYLNILK